jgi:hypothetical protein
LRSRMDPESISGGANRKNPAKPIRVRFCQVHLQGRRHRWNLPAKAAFPS